MKAKDDLVKFQQTIKTHPAQVAAIAVAVIATIALICILCLRGCDGSNAVDENPTGAANQTRTSALPNASTPEADLAAPEATQGEPQGKEQSAEAVTGQDATGNGFSDSGSQSAGTVSEQASNSTPLGDNNAGSSDGNESTPSAPSKTWVVDYVQVWVQDFAAWDESVPIYSAQEKSICNICGADITGNEVAHGKAHMMAGEGSGHHTEMVQVVTGSDTVHHEAIGHYETVESGGHWE